jgi:ABC-type multidrug transport system ATPase subunit
MSQLHVDSILKSYNSKQVLTDIFLTCNQGEIIGLIGRNGSGKSTLLKVIFGSLSAEQKFVKVGNKQINTIKDSFNLIKYLPQHGFLPNHLRIKTLIGLFCNNLDAEIISNHRLINQHLIKRTNQLSSGERRILEILLIVYSNAKYILIDEPFNGVAPVFKEEIMQIIKAQSQDKGFIITDHDYRNVLKISTKLIVIKDGGTKAIKSNSDLEKFGYININSQNI